MNIQTLIDNLLIFLNDVIIPFLLAIAFFMFLWNAARYFIFQGGSEEGQSKARILTQWSITAFVVILSFWGIVNLIAQGIGLDGNRTIVPDYVCEKKGGNCVSSSNPTPSQNTPSNAETYTTPFSGPQ